MMEKPLLSSPAAPRQYKKFNFEGRISLPSASPRCVGAADDSVRVSRAPPERACTALGRRDLLSHVHALGRRVWLRTELSL